MKRVIIAAAFVASVALAAERTPGPGPDGMPFGPVDNADVDHLWDFALKRGFDLKAEVLRVYASNGADEEALGRVFVFSRQFSALDKDARTYGQIIYSSLLNIGEHIGLPAYVKIIDRQPPDVRQRIRDFMFYVMVRHVPKSEWKATLENDRKTDSGLFPKDFQFAHDDPIFADEDLTK